LAVSRHERECTARAPANHDLIAALDIDLVSKVGLLPHLTVFKRQDEFAGRAPVNVRHHECEALGLYRSTGLAFQSGSRAGGSACGLDETYGRNGRETCE